MIKPLNYDPSDYYSAMASPRWTAVRQQIIDRDGGRCRICGCRGNLQVHHIRYQNEAGENDFFNPKWLVTLCRPCHQIISDAVKEAKDLSVEVPVSVKLTHAGWNRDKVIETALCRGFYEMEQKHTIKTFFRLWKRSLDDDCGRVNFRDIKTLKSFERIIIDSLMYQADWPYIYSDDGPAYIAKLQERITEYIAAAYNRDMAEGVNYYAFMSAYKLNDVQMVKVRRNAQRLAKNGSVRQGVKAGVGMSG